MITMASSVTFSGFMLTVSCASNIPVVLARLIFNKFFNFLVIKNAHCYIRFFLHLIKNMLLRFGGLFCCCYLLVFYLGFDKIYGYIKIIQVLWLAQQLQQCYKFGYLDLHQVYDHGHNVLRMFDGLQIFPFTTSETKPDC